ncbi:MAG: hypothetical protein EOP05_11290 [Proteobacteria bacterium]|nr:MAG: hypothetical protein EOP05_11290 [Pseudomonadota bacterium]
MKFRVWILAAVLLSMFSIEALADVETAENLSSILDELEHQTSGAHQSCFAPKSGAAAKKDVPAMTVCLHLGAYSAAVAPLTFTPADPVNPCVIHPEWSTGKPPWTVASNRPAMAVHATVKAVAPKRVDVLKNGFRVRGAAERVAYLKSIELRRDEFALSCCGSNSRCTDAMKAVRVLSCSSDADKDPNQPDHCALLSGYFEFNQVEKSNISALVAGNQFTGIQSGSVILSPYVTATGEDYASAKIINHELGHACSFIRRQVGATEILGIDRAGSNKSLAAWNDGTCGIGSDVDKEAYGPMMNQVGFSLKVADCISNLARRSTDPASTAFFENSCPASKSEEGMAEAFAISQTKPLVPKAFPNWLCSARPSTRHPAMSDVLACVLKNDASTRQRLAREYGCKGVK